ncbi:alpha/beta hydrolase [Nocardia sp. XZ_19_385]|uniref:alpha/beta hydrolase n=1 Tax=Nocardia sp. XZ_19_385 TaxID=2769488 RepID=UPI00188FF945|nr:alpha/beta hydrolase [Nocardia sp. XZ_19_385]
MRHPEAAVLPATRRSDLVGRLCRTMRTRIDDWTLTDRSVRIIRLLADSTGILRNPLTARSRSVRTESIRGQWVHAGRRSSAGVGAILYLHGGCYFFGSSRSHYGIAKRLSQHAGCPVFLLDYPLAPEQPFPAAQDATLAAYRLLLDTGLAPESIAIAGDSAGGHLTAALLNDIHRLGLPMPAAAALYSPAADLSGELARQANLRAPDPLLPFAFLAEGAASYLGGVPPTDPRVDILAADKRRWPPILIQIGELDILRDDAHALAESLHAADRDCALQIWPGQPHVFQILAGVLPQGRAAIRCSADFLRSRMVTGPAGHRPDEEQGPAAE